jgi:protein-S-isoprenylcysteine O-methyltransferase Ste14
MNQQSGPQDSLVLSYLGLRKAVGIIGSALPFVLAFGKILLQGPGIQGSISGYYYTDMRNVFVGSLCAIGVFLMSCRGYDRKDEIAGYLSCFFAIGVAFFPTTPDMSATSRDRLIGTLHLSFAALFFLTLAYFSLKLFTKTDPNKNPTRRKLQRNTVYRVCGYTILLCIFLCFIVALPRVKSLLAWLTPVFWLESVAIVAFGVSWLTKGETILKDQET